ncbi:hypothetical protein [Curtobacterium sp. MCBA15_004]|uniref:SGNH/GDSL hydrolase family protein n=1 Tax=unclassified Curtobacterium TaxID=257496 RepID=UPI0008DC5E42|nr:hypothetical protein [Curtobacterium sp. MCBA15_004]WIA97295.1 hypothetical protein QOL16_02550 [Curtobacterium sp. MCBA15_004]
MPTVVFYGDSIVTGWRGISSPNKRWTTIVSERLGWRELNLAINGVGFVRRRGADRTDDGEALGLLPDYPPGWKAVRQILQEETHRVGLRLVPGLATAINRNDALLCSDGVHPDDAGHAALADSIEPHLRAALFQ